MIAIIIILCIELIMQIIKIVRKRNIIEKNLIDYYLEYIVSIVIFAVLFFQKNISENILFIVLMISLLYEIISYIYMYYKYYKKENINNFSIKKVIDTSDFGILVLKGKKVELINNTMYEIIREATTNAIKHAGSTNIFVEITETLEETTMKITNDGKRANEFIAENEGIKGMRRKVSKLNGIFYIQTIPQFSVNVIIKS